ncbi:MAG: hypothetical protein P8X63_04085, partial [Desulfuromonadaceae bacterium]
GLRRFNSFWDEVQLEFKICFRLSDRDKDYSLNEFVARVIELTKSKKSSLAAIRYQMKQGIEWQIFIFMNIVILIPFIFIRQYAAVFVTYIVIVLLVNFKFFSFYARTRNYQKRLFEAINGQSI